MAYCGGMHNVWKHALPQTVRTRLATLLSRSVQTLTEAADRFLPYAFLPPVLQFKRDGWNEKIYGSVSSARTIVVFGGYLGDSTASWLERFPNAKLLVFEPVEPFADAIRERFRGTGVEVFNFGISGNAERRTFHLMGDATSGLTVARLGQVAAGPTSTEVEFKPIGELEELFGLHGDIDVLEINIEGGEYELLKLLHQESLLANAGKIFVQFHTVGSKTNAQVRCASNLLSKTHTLTWRYKLVWDLWERRL